MYSLIFLNFYDVMCKTRIRQFSLFLNLEIYLHSRNLSPSTLLFPFFCRKEMTVIRLKGIIISGLYVLYFTTLSIAALISVTTLALTGTHLSSFVIFTLVVGLVTLRFIFSVNLSTALYMVTEAKVALNRIQVFLKEKVSNSQETVEPHENNQLLTEQRGNLMVKYKGTKKIANYGKENDSTDENSRTFISNSVPAISKETASEDPLLACIDGETSVLATSNQTCQPFISILDASCSWHEDHLSDTLCNITLNIRKGEMLAVTGAVGSGKSSLLTAILGELPVRTGTVSYHGKVAYVPQIPWVFSGTVRENILFGLPFDEDRFQHVVHICSLTKDLIDFTNGDLTEIGQRGVTLSGGQKARVGLARAVYSDADIYLLDDPLSAVDTKVGSKLFESCILGYLSGRIRLLATHQLQYLKNVDRIAVMEKGAITCVGSYEELKEKGVFLGIVELSESFEDDPGRTEKVSYEQNIEELPHGSFSAQSFLEKGHSYDDHSLSSGLKLEKNSVVCQENGAAEPKESGSSQLTCTSIDEVSEQGNIEKLLGERPPSPVLSGKEHDELEVLELQVDETVYPESVGLIPKSMLEPDQRTGLDLKESKEHNSTGTVSWRLYWKYLKEGLAVPWIILIFLLLILTQGKVKHNIL